jgi:hypothetical protein
VESLEIFSLLARRVANPGRPTNLSSTFMIVASMLLATALVTSL